MVTGMAWWPLTYAQRARLVRDQVRGPVPFNLNVTFDVDGHIDEAALRAALGRLMSSHPMLRAHLSPDAAGMLVPATCEPDLVVRAGLTADEVERALAERGDRFPDRRRPPLWSCQLLSTVDGRQVLAFTFDHLVMDAGSMSIALRDFVSGAVRDGDPAGADAYGAFAADQQARYGSGAADALAYWHEHLRGTALNRPVVPSFCLDPKGPLAGRRQAVTVAFDAGQRSLVAAGAARHRVTLFVLYLAAVAAVLSKVSGERDMTIRVLTSGRRPQFAETVGWFANMVLLRLSDVDVGDQGRLVATVRGTWARQLPHQTVPYQLVLKHIEPERTITDYRPSVVTVNALTVGPPLRFGDARLVGRPDAGGAGEEPGLQFVLIYGAGVMAVECWHDPARYAAADLAMLLDMLKQQLLDMAEAPRGAARAARTGWQPTA
ncbi:condensation domain-containing protein [Dactylosporangium sp. NPDC048998]|uniref:condensation domain-containing protein n=1 Tax=Dactylosporangium sp. NPDC048998 TaxID=3363976 RepID=UPI00371E3A43